MAGRVLTGWERDNAIKYLNKAREVAQGSCCLSSRSGAVIVAPYHRVIGKGFNSPPGNIPVERCRKDELPEDFRSDTTCCVHAEKRAIRDALSRTASKVKGAIMYYIRTDLQGNMKKAGMPYCTGCSKEIADSELAGIVLWHDTDEIKFYNANEYNTISFKHADNTKR